jgi:hypothetical protein
VVPEIGFDVPTQGIPSGDVESADVCSPTSDNAIQLVVFPKFIGDASEKVVRLADIHRIPVSVERLLAENVNAREGVISGPDGMEVKAVAFTSRSKPRN